MEQFQCCLPRMTCSTSTSALLCSNLLYSAPLYSTLLYSTLLYSTHLSSTLLYSSLLYSSLLDTVLLLLLPLPYSTLLLLYSSQLYTALLYSTSTLLFATLHSVTLLHPTSTLLFATLHSVTLLYFYTLLYSTLLYFTLHGFTLLYSYFCLYSTCTKVLDCKEDSPAGNKHLLDNSPILTIISGDVGQWGRFPRMTRDFYAVLLRRDIRDCGCTAAWSRGLSIAKLHGIILNFESMRMCHMSLRCCTFL